MINRKNVTPTPKRAHRPGRPTLEGAQAIRSRIVAAAMKLFIEMGFEATSMDLIARRANVSKRTLYDRFHSKEDVFLATVEDMAAQRLQALQEITVRSRSLRASLEEISMKLIACIAVPEFVAFERIIAAEVRRFPDLAQERLQRGLHYLADMIADVLKCHAPYEAMTDKEVGMNARIFLSMAVLPPLRAAMFSEDAKGEPDKEFIGRAIAIFMRGTAPEEEKAAQSARQKGRTPATATASMQAAPDTTRGRILLAAMRRFSLASYEDTGLRDIAAEAGVDAAYVHRSFGSKEALFLHALEAASDDRRLLTITSGPDIPRAIATLFGQRRNADKNGPVHPLDIVIRSLCSPTALAALRGKIQSDLIGPLAANLDQPSSVRASMVAAMLIGIGIATKVLQLPALAQDDGAAEAILETVIAAIMTART